jgi:hypothetical protein
MLQTRVSQPRLRDFHAVNGHLPPLGALRACEAAARLMRTKGGEGGIKQIARFRCAPDSRVVLVQTPHKRMLRRAPVQTVQPPANGMI